jgi:signal transduction histidine kinase
VRVRSITLRLALIYTGAFAVAVSLLAVGVLLGTRATLREQFEVRIRAESAALSQEYVTEGLEELAHAVRERDRTPGALLFGLEAPDQTRIEGRLASLPTPLGWSDHVLHELGREPRNLHVLTVRLRDGHRLLVGDDLAHVQSLDGVLLSGFALAILGVLLLGGAGGYVLSRGVRRRFAAIASVADSIAEGDLRQRVQVRRSNDDLDQLGLTLNRMLDRIGTLLESLRQVSNDVAHDLRTPLTRLRQRLEGALRTTDHAARSSAIEEAMVDLDAILETFAAMLRIAQIEGGARRAGFQPVDLTNLARHVVDSFAPSAEQGGRTLVLEARSTAPIVGDAELLTQMLVNLVENGLRHTPVGSHVRLGVVTLGGRAVVQVADDGPGVPPSKRDHILKRFYRLEQSRSTPGSGLGLSLVAAVAKLHEAEVVLADAAPGLEVRVSFRLLTANRVIGNSQ